LLLQNEIVALRLAPGLGGGVQSFRWRGCDVFHTRPSAAGPLALGCFTLSPFSGRIAQGRFAAHGRAITLNRNHPSDPDHPHTLHGFDWLAPFETAEATEMRAVMRRRSEGEWPWRFETQQVFTLTNNGYRHAVSITNLAAEPMPAGLGLHPYFPKADARLTLEVDGVWETEKEPIPSHRRALSKSPGWLDGAAIDHCFTGRRGSILIDWPSHRLTIEPDPAFSFAVVFTPAGEDYFCVEPVSHMPNAVNRTEPPAETGLRWLAPGERWTTSTAFEVSPNS
jgi:aldose 1-epimerase